MKMQQNLSVICAISIFSVLLLGRFAHSVTDRNQQIANSPDVQPVGSVEGKQRQLIVIEYDGQGFKRISQESYLNEQHSPRMHIATVPTYEYGAIPMKEERLEFDRMVMDEVTRKIDGFMKKMTDKKRKVPILVDGAKFAVEVKSMADRFEAKLEVLKKDKDNRVLVEDEFTESMARFIMSILDSRSATKLTNSEVYGMCVVILETAKKLVAVSPVGLYLDWSQMTIDGMSFTDYSAPIIQWIRDESFIMRKVLDIARKLTHWLANRAKSYSKTLQS